MPLVTKPIALDESFNTTGDNSENIADVVKVGLSEIASAITDLDASGIEYDNTTSGLTADNVQGAVDELVSEKADKSALSDYQTVSISPVQIGGVNQSTVEGAVSALATQSNSNKSVVDSLGDLAFINKDGVSSTKFLKGDGSWGTVPDGQIQSDWEQSDDTKKDYIKNKPQDLVHTSDTVGLLKNDGTVDSTGYLPKSGGTMTGTITTPSDNTKGVLPKTTNTGTIGSSTLRYYSGYFNNLYLGVGNNTAITGIDSTPTSGNTQKLVTSDGIKSAIDAAVAAIYKPSGSKTCAQLVSSLLVAENQGNVYNMTDSGTTTSDFVEGQGNPIRAGDNVAIVKVDNSFKFDLLSGFVDLSGYIAKASTPTGLLKDDGSVDKTDYAPLSSIKDLAYISKPTGSDAGSKYLSGSGSWVKLTIPTVTDTYNGTSSDGMSGKAVKSAIDALDVSNISGFGAGKTLSALSETNGKISASFQDISITKSQVSDFPDISARNTWFGTCDTAVATAAKTVTTSSGDFVLETGNMVRVKFTNGNSFNGVSTLSVDDSTAKNIVSTGSNTSAGFFWNSGEVVDFVYDGTNFVMSDAGIATTSYFGITKLVTAGDSTSVNTSLTPGSLNQFAENMITGYPVYSSTSTYAVGDCVRYGFNSYSCKVEITTAESFNAAHWDVIPDLQSQIDDKVSLSSLPLSVENGGTGNAYGKSPYLLTHLITDANVLVSGSLANNSITRADLIQGTASNHTPTENWYTLLTLSGTDSGSDYATQLGLGMTKEALYYRRKVNGTWDSSWKELAFKSDIPDASYSGGTGIAISAANVISIKYYGNHTEAASGGDNNGKRTGMADEGDGLFLTGSYNDSNAPYVYGNIINVSGTGTGQLFLGWKGDSTTGAMYYRSHRDNGSAAWGPWKQIAYTDNSITTFSGTLAVGHGGTGATSFTSGHALIGNGTGALTTKAISDSTSAGALSTGSNLVTERDVYYGTPKINNSKSYTSSTTIYAPTGGGTAGQYLKAAGSTSTPTWQTADTTPTSDSSNLVTSGGVYDAISKKANTFIGTTAEWNALSSSEKVEYEIVNITDDGSAISGGGLTVKYVDTSVTSNSGGGFPIPTTLGYDRDKVFSIISKDQSYWITPPYWEGRFALIVKVSSSFSVSPNTTVNVRIYYHE